MLVWARVRLAKAHAAAPTRDRPSPRPDRGPQTCLVHPGASTLGTARASPERGPRRQLHEDVSLGSSWISSFQDGSGASTTPTPVTLKPQRRQGRHPVLQELRGQEEKRGSEPCARREGPGFSSARRLQHSGEERSGQPRDHPGGTRASAARLRRTSVGGSSGSACLAARPTPARPLWLTRDQRSSVSGQRRAFCGHVEVAAPH